jgi:hypothetical protein
VLLKTKLELNKNFKFQGSRPAKLEKADVLELTVNYVQKLHKERRNNLRDNSNDGSTSCPIPNSFSPRSNQSSRFKDGFIECARIVREVLHNQPQQTMEGDLQKRVGQYLDRCLTNLVPELLTNRKSPSPSLGSDSCTSFEEKDMEPSEFVMDSSSPANRICSSTSEESRDSCSRRSFSNEINSFDLTSTPNSSPSNALNVIPSRWTCGFKSVPFFGSPDLSAENLNQGNKWENHQVVPSSMSCERKWKTSDANIVELFACGVPSTSAFPSDSSSSSLTSNQHYQHSPEVIYRHQISLYDDHISSPSLKSDADHMKVWRPW